MDNSQLWAKAARGRMHPLTHHMLDSAFVARELWSRLVSVRMRGALGGPPDTTIAFLAGLHDLGKASPAFQGKVPSLAPVDAPRSSRPEYAHGVVTGHHLRTSATFLAAFGASSPRLAQTLAGHHGIVPDVGQLADAGRPRARAHVGAGLWIGRRESLVAWLWDAVGRPVAPAEWRDEPIDVATAVFLLGLVSVADWIASNERWFPYSFEPVDGYAETSRRRADAAVGTLGFQAWKPLAQGPEERMGVARLHATQEATAGAARSGRAPGVVIVESETGSGKTEAALDLAAEFVAAGLASGLYFAMPTRATSNALYDRLRRFLSRTSDQPDVGLQLIHGRASLHGEFAASLDARRVAPTSVWDDDLSGTSVVAESWFSYRRRGLLCPLGVGVVDEILLAAQQARYGYVRLYGLADKVVIVDEVHAYDDYMMVLLEVALEWFGLWGTRVVLLSATLPSATRRRLLAAYGCSVADRPAAADYPVVTSGSRGSPPTAVPAAPTRARSLALEWLPGDVDGIDDGVSAAVRLAQGADVLLLRNTIDRAQRSASRIRELHPKVEVLLLHSRIPFLRRDEREQEVLARFGRDGDRPRGSVTVATQVVEQSLDVDFDVLITDLAPTDLLLQRAGRVQRHRHADARVIITGYLTSGDALTLEPGGSAIYGEYRMVRTHRALGHRREIKVPVDVVHVMEATYGDTTDPDLEVLREADEARRLEDQGEADRRRLPHAPIEHLEQINEHCVDDDENIVRKHRALSRLGESIEVVVVDEANRDADPTSLDGWRMLMEGSLSLGSPRGLVTALRDAEVEEWKGTRMKFFRKLELGADESVAVAGADSTYHVRLDEFLGLVVAEER